MKRTIDGKAGVLETERVYDVSITQLKSSLCTDVPLPQKKGYLRADVCKYRPEVGK